MTPPRIKERQTEVTCAFCKGTGKDPFGIMSRLSACYACMGERKVWVEEPAVKCPYCGGNGVSPLGARNYCLVCRGAGLVAVKENAGTCPDCNGTGSEKRSGLYCITCRGKGVVTSD